MSAPLPQIKLLPSIIGCKSIRTSINCFRKICHLWGKGYFAVVGKCRSLSAEIQTACKTATIYITNIS